MKDEDHVKAEAKTPKAYIYIHSPALTAHLI